MNQSASAADPFDDDCTPIVTVASARRIVRIKHAKTMARALSTADGRWALRKVLRNMISDYGNRVDEVTGRTYAKLLGILDDPLAGGDLAALVKLLDEKITSLEMDVDFPE